MKVPHNSNGLAPREVNGQHGQVSSSSRLCGRWAKPSPTPVGPVGRQISKLDSLGFKRQRLGAILVRWWRWCILELKIFVHNFLISTLQTPLEKANLNLLCYHYTGFSTIKSFRCSACKPSGAQRFSVTAESSHHQGSCTTLHEMLPSSQPLQRPLRAVGSSLGSGGRHGWLVEACWSYGGFQKWFLGLNHINYI